MDWRYNSADKSVLRRTIDLSYAPCMHAGNDVIHCNGLVALLQSRPPGRVGPII